MAKTTKKRLRATWLQVHKWIGLTLAILIIPISLTGSALVWKGWVDQQLQPQRYASLHAPGCITMQCLCASRHPIMPRLALSHR